MNVKIHKLPYSPMNKSFYSFPIHGHEIFFMGVGLSLLHKPKFWKGVNFSGGIFGYYCHAFFYQIFLENLWGRGLGYPGGRLDFQKERSKAV